MAWDELGMFDLGGIFDLGDPGKSGRSLGVESRSWSHQSAGCQASPCWLGNWLSNMATF